MGYIVSHISIGRCYRIGNLLSPYAGHMFNHWLVTDQRFELRPMLDLLVVSIRDLNCLVISVLDGLIVRYCFSDLYFVANRCVRNVDVLSLVSHLFVSYYRLVIRIKLFNRHELRPCFCSRCIEGLHWGVKLLTLHCDH